MKIERDWTKPQPCGSGEVHIAEYNGGFAIVVDGQMRSFRSKREKAERAAASVFEGLREEPSCPVCGRYIGLNQHGIRAPHAQPKVWDEKPRPCPGGGMRGAP